MNGAVAEATSGTPAASASSAVRPKPSLRDGGRAASASMKERHHVRLLDDAQLRNGGARARVEAGKLRFVGRTVGTVVQHRRSTDNPEARRAVLGAKASERPHHAQGVLARLDPTGREDEWASVRAEPLPPGGDSGALGGRPPREVHTVADHGTVDAEFRRDV